MNAFKLGPLVLPYSVLLVLIAIVVGMTLTKRYEAKTGLRIESHVLRILAVVALVARAAFVWRYHTLYFSAPWTILDIRDSGWDAQIGIIAGWIYTGILANRNGFLRRPLVVIVGSVSALWIVGTLALLLMSKEVRELPVKAVLDMAGHEVTLSTYRGKPTVLNFWATWCPPCQREMPAMEKVQKSREDVHFVFLNQGETPDMVNAFLSAGRLSLDNVLLDRTGLISREFSVMGYPTTLFFDASGKLVYEHLGEMSEATLRHQLSVLEKEN